MHESAHENQNRTSGPGRKLAKVSPSSFAGKNDVLPGAKKEKKQNNIYMASRRKGFIHNIYT